MKYYIVPNWNFSNKEIHEFNSIDSLNDYAETNNIIVTLVDDNSFYYKKYKLSNDSIIYVGW